MDQPPASSSSETSSTPVPPPGASPSRPVLASRPMPRALQPLPRNAPPWSENRARKPKRRRFRLPSWLDVTLRIARVVILLGVALVVLALTPLGRPLLALEQTVGHLFLHPAKTPTVAATTTRTPTPLPTATPLPAGAPLSRGGAKLGASLAPFDAIFGTPIVVEPGVIYGFQPHCGLDGTADCEEATLAIGQDGHGYVDILALASPPAQGWDSTTAHRICESYMPADAQFQQSITSGNVAVSRVYTSTHLAQVFPDSVFLDPQGNHVPVGTFTIRYRYDVPGDFLFSDCQLATGIAT